MDMSKRKSLGGKMIAVSVTPPKLQASNLFKTKTSTPIKEPQLKPIAQSTPGSSPTDRSSFSILKLDQRSPTNSARFNSYNSTRSSQSASTPNLSNQSGSAKRDSFIPSPKFIYRRHSATELKTTEKVSSLTRSYSIGPNNKQVLMNKLKQTVPSLTNTPVRKSSLKAKDTLPTNKRNVLNESNTGAIIKNIKSLSLLGKIKKNKDGKENAKKY